MKIKLETANNMLDKICDNYVKNFAELLEGLGYKAEPFLVANVEKIEEITRETFDEVCDILGINEVEVD